MVGDDGKQDAVLSQKIEQRDGAGKTADGSVEGGACQLFQPFAALKDGQLAVGESVEKKHK